MELLPTLHQCYSTQKKCLNGLGDCLLRFYQHESCDLIIELLYNDHNSLPFQFRIYESQDIPIDLNKYYHRTLPIVNMNTFFHRLGICFIYRDKIRIIKSNLYNNITYIDIVPV